MKVNMNIIVGGTDDMLIDILSVARTVRKEMKIFFESIEIEALQKMDICLCFSGNISKYYSESGIYQPRYYFTTKKFVVYVHFCSNEWTSNREENLSKFLKIYKNYLLELSNTIKKKMANRKSDFDNECYEDMIRRVFENLEIYV